MHALLTIDVWDTLLRRRCHPDAVKLHTANLLFQRLGAVFGDGRPQPIDLLRSRLEVEKSIAAESRRKGEDGEYRLKDVLRTWTLESGVSNGEKVDALVDTLVAEEWEQECFVSYPDPGIIAFLEHYPAERTLFLSDFYMEREQLQALLIAKGLGHVAPDGFVSCDCGLNKASGRLFGCVQERLGVSPAQHLHIGDNRHSDFEVPERLGMHAVWYRNRREEQARRAHFVTFRAAVPIQKQLRKNLRSLRKSGPMGVAGAAFQVGLALSPLFAGFALFTLERARRDHVERLFFLSREGEFLHRVYEAMVTPGAPRAAHGQILEVSRLATFAASLREASAAELGRLWSGFSKQSMRMLALSLNFEEHVMIGACSRISLDPNKVFADPGSEPCVLELLSDPGLQTALQASIDLQRSRLLEYLAQQGFLGRDRIGIVDIGWRGSIQDNLAMLHPDIAFSGYYLGLQAYQNPLLANSSKFAFGPDLNRSPLHAALFRNLPLMEMIATSAGGSVIGYVKQPDGSVVAERQRDAPEESTFASFSAPLQDGILRGVSAFAPSLLAHAKTSDDLRPPALSAWDRLVRHPPAVVADALEGLHHNEIFGRGEFTRHRVSRKWWSRLPALRKR